MGAFSLSLGCQWTPPSAPANSGNSTIVVTGTENAQNVGRIDVPAAQASGTSYEIPLGSIDSLKTVIVQNGLSNELAVHINGAVAATFGLGAGQTFVFAGNTAPVLTPITQLTLKTTTIQGSAISYISYYSFGD